MRSKVTFRMASELVVVALDVFLRGFVVRSRQQTPYDFSLRRPVYNSPTTSCQPLNDGKHELSRLNLARFTSSFTCQPISLIIPALIILHSFTLSLQAQNLPFQQILSTLAGWYLHGGTEGHVLVNEFLYPTQWN